MKTWIITQICKGALRHILSGIGTSLFTAGYLSASQTSQFVAFALQCVGGFLFLLGVGLSACHKESVGKALEELASQIDPEAPKALVGASPLAATPVVTPAASSPGTPVKAAQIMTGVAILLFAFFAPSSAKAQTATPTNTNAAAIKLPAISLGLPTIPTNMAPVANDILSWFEAYVPSLTNRAISLEVAGLWHTNIGFAADLEYNITTNFSIGIGPELLDRKDWYINFGSATLGTDIKIPVIGSTHVSIQQDAVTQVKTWGIGSQTMNKYFKSFDIFHSGTKMLTFDAEAGVGINSFKAGTIKEFSGKFNYAW